MSKKKQFKHIEQLLMEGSDEDVLLGFAAFLSARVALSVDFIEDDDVVRATVLRATSGDKSFVSSEKKCWPMITVKASPEIVKKTH